MMATSALSLAALFAEREARQRQDREAAEHLQRRKEEELAEFRKRLENFQLTDQIIQSGLDRIRRAFERGETELMIASFPSDFCTDGGRAVSNAGAPPINKPTGQERATRTEEPEWLATLPAGAQGPRLLEGEPEARRFPVRRPHHRLPRRDAGKYRSVLHLAGERRGSLRGKR